MSSSAKSRGRSAPRVSLFLCRRVSFEEKSLLGGNWNVTKLGRNGRGKMQDPVLCTRLRLIRIGVASGDVIKLSTRVMNTVSIQKENLVPRAPVFPYVSPSTAQEGAGVVCGRSEESFFLPSEQMLLESFQPKGDDDSVITSSQINH